MFSSATVNILCFTDELCEAIIRIDNLRLRYAAARAALFAEEVIVLRLKRALCSRRSNGTGSMFEGS